jgi:hypothetical protein
MILEFMGKNEKEYSITTATFLLFYSEIMLHFWKLDGKYYI